MRIDSSMLLILVPGRVGEFLTDAFLLKYSSKFCWKPQIKGYKIDLFVQLDLVSVIEAGLFIC